MSVLHLERHQVDPARRPAFDDAIKALLDAMRRAGGFLWADAAGSILEPEIVTVASEWRTGGDLDAFCDSDEYRSFCDDNDVRVREAPTIRRYADGP